MALEKFLEDVEVIQKLGTFPNADDGLTAEELKAKFDEAPKKIKSYLNDTLIPAVAKLQTEQSGQNGLIVTISGNYTDGFTATSTLAEILSVHKERSVRCVLGGYCLPLVYIDDNHAFFAAIDSNGKMVRMVDIENQGGVTVSSTELLGANDRLYTVNMTHILGSTYSVDKPFEAVLAVHNAGTRLIQCRIKVDGLDYVLPLCNATDNMLVYAGAVLGTALTVIQTTAGASVFTREDTAVCDVHVTGNADGGYTADKTLAEINAAYKAGRELRCVVPVDDGTALAPLVNVINDDGRMTYNFGCTVAGMDASDDVSSVSVSLHDNSGELDVAVRIDRSVEGGEGADMLCVEVYKKQGKWVSNSYYNEILDAINSGRPCICRFASELSSLDSMWLTPVQHVNADRYDYIYFRGIFEDYQIVTVRFMSNTHENEIEVTRSNLPHSALCAVHLKEDGSYYLHDGFDFDKLKAADDIRHYHGAPAFMVCMLQTVYSDDSNEWEFVDLQLIDSDWNWQYVFGGVVSMPDGTFYVKVTIQKGTGGNPASVAVERQRLAGQGIYTVTVTADGSGKYTPDKSYEEVLAVHNAGERTIQCRVTMGGISYVLPLVGVAESILVYGGTAGFMAAAVSQSPEAVVVTTTTLASAEDINEIDLLIGGES